MTSGPLSLELVLDAKDVQKYIESQLPILKAVGEERARQIAKGYDQDKDDTNAGTFWSHLVQREAHYAAGAAHGDGDAHGFRQRMVRVIALAWASIEAFDRQESPSDLDITESSDGKDQ